MPNVNRFAPVVKAGKQKAKSNAKSGTETAPLSASVRLPLYCAAGGLLMVYGWGALESMPMAAGVALCAVFAMSEMLKPKLGELAAEALIAKDKLGAWLMLGASVACIALGALGGVIAMGAAHAPREAYNAAAARLAGAQSRLDQAQARLDAVPTCTPDMPAFRCREQTEQNAATLQDRTQTRDQAKQERDGAKAYLDAMDDPGPGLPSVALWQKALVIAAVEFVLFAVPFAARRRRLFEEWRERLIEEAPEREPKEAPVKMLKVNDGGWERRRALYGPSGRKGSRHALQPAIGNA
jgi:hypothetical protein